MDKRFKHNIIAAVYYFDGIKIICLDRKDGKQLWQTEEIKTRPFTTAYSPRMVIYEDVVLFSSGVGKTFGQGTIYAFSALDGRKLWDAPQPGSGHYSPEDVFVINGLVWTGRTANVQDDGNYYGRDLHTGELVEEIPGYKAKYWFHQRCYPSKATKNYIIPSRTGIEFVDLKNRYWDINHYVRGGCIYGIMPSNGLIYSPPHACACYMEAKLNGFCAMAPISNTGPDPKAASARSGEAAESNAKATSSSNGSNNAPFP